jgi:hypothetical protein
MRSALRKGLVATAIVLPLAVGSAAMAGTTDDWLSGSGDKGAATSAADAANLAVPKSGIAKDSGNRLDPGESLSPTTQYLTSNSKVYVFGLQPDCNLVLYKDATPSNGIIDKENLTAVGASGTRTRDDGYVQGDCDRFEMQHDGNGVIYRPGAVDGRDALWSTRTEGLPDGSYLQVEDSGTLAFYDRNNQRLDPNTRV